MPETFIALLRGVNVGGNKKVAMSDLRAMLEDLGYANVRTLLQSGNAVFQGRAATRAAIEQRLEKEAAARLKIDCGFFVRTAAEWRAIVDRNPFRAEAASMPGYTVVMCLKGAPKPADVKKLEGAIPGREKACIAGTEAYLIFPDGQGPSKFTNAVIEKALGTRGTARNWNTVLKVAAAVEKA